MNTAKTSSAWLSANQNMENLSHTGKRVVIIDDETDFCLLMKNYFLRKNFEVHIFHTLEEGMKNMDSIKPDIIFLDNNLPDGLGWEKTKYISEHFPNARINLISAYQYDHSFSENTAFCQNLGKADQFNGSQ